MVGFGRRFAAFLWMAFVLVTWSAFADSRTTFLVDRLKADDFRVRTNAALALGATNDDGAVQPLCNALNDSSDVVRQAAAAALKRLARSSAVGCMKARLSSESSDAVKLQLTRAIESLEGSGGGGDTPRTVPNAKFYLSVTSGTTNVTSRDVLGAVVGAFKGKLDSQGTYQFAPRTETPDAARSIMTRRNLKGFYLTVSVELSDTAQGLKALVRIAVAGYPAKDIRGEVAPYAIAPGTKRGDAAVEDSLVRAVAERAADQFAQNFQ